MGFVCNFLLARAEKLGLTGRDRRLELTRIDCPIQEVFRI